MPCDFLGNTRPMKPPAFAIIWNTQLQTFTRNFTPSLTFGGSEI